MWDLLWWWIIVEMNMLVFKHYNRVNYNKQSSGVLKCWTLNGSNCLLRKYLVPSTGSDKKQVKLALKATVYNRSYKTDWHSTIIIYIHLPVFTYLFDYVLQMASLTLRTAEDFISRPLQVINQSISQSQVNNCVVGVRD